MIMRTLCVLLLAGGVLSVPGAAAARETKGAAAIHRVRVAAASDLRFALEEIVAKFRGIRPGVEIPVTYGSSGNFFSQLSNKAPYDLFLSADAEYTRKLAEAGLAVRDSEFWYARGRLVLWVAKASSLDVERRGLEALTDPSVRKIAIANPRHAPYGRAAEAALRAAGLYEKVQDRLVLGENIAQTAQFVQSGAADAGLIALSLATAPALRNDGRFWTVPATLHPKIGQGGAILAWAADPPAARDFVAFLTSAAGQEILARYGFDPPGK
jgi:molybdate transport system substrate-binding protein